MLPKPAKAAGMKKENSRSISVMELECKVPNQIVENGNRETEKRDWGAQKMDGIGQKGVEKKRWSAFLKKKSYLSISG